MGCSIWYAKIVHSLHCDKCEVVQIPHPIKTLNKRCLNAGCKAYNNKYVVVSGSDGERERDIGVILLVRVYVLAQRLLIMSFLK